MLPIMAGDVQAVPTDQTTNQTPPSTGASNSPNSAPPSHPAKIPAGPSNLVPSPSRLMISSVSGESSTRKVWLIPGVDQSSVSWVVGQAVTADGLYALPDSALVLNSNKSDSISLEPGKPTLLPVQINLGDVHSGEYTADIFLYSTNTSSTVQVVVRVKDRPCWPIIVLLVGIVLSFTLSQYREAGRQHDILVLQASKLEQMLAADQGFLTAVEFKDAIASKLNEIRCQLDEGRSADATAEMATAMKMMDNWLVYKTTWLQLFAQLNSLRQQAATSTDPNVQSHLGQALQAAADAAGVGTPSPLSTAIQALATACRPVGGAPQLTSGKQLLFTPREVSKARAYTTAYLWTSYLVMIALFFFVGYKELYDAKPVFGANSLVDYFALVLWGLGVETTTRTSLSSVAKSWGIPGFN